MIETIHIIGQHKLPPQEALDLARRIIIELGDMVLAKKLAGMGISRMEYNSVRSNRSAAMRKAKE